MALPATDNFTDTNGVQLTTHNASWTLNKGNFDIQSNALASDQNGETGAHWNADSFDDDQYAQADGIAKIAVNAIGLAVRCSLTGGVGTYYGFYADGYDVTGHTYLFKMVSGSWTQLGVRSNDDIVGKLMRVEVSGTTLTPLLDGVLEDPPGVQTDAAISSGAAGVSGWNDQPTGRIDNWEGGNLAGDIIGPFPTHLRT